MTAENERTVREFLERMSEEVWSRGNLDAMDDFYAPYYVSHGHNTPSEGKVRTPEEVKKSTALMRDAFPDARMRIGEIVASQRGEEAYVSYHYRFTGTHLGNMAALAPTGRRVEVMGICIYRLVDGRVLEEWSILDIMGMMSQLGVDLVPRQSSASNFQPPPRPGYQQRAVNSNATRNGWTDLALLVAFGLGWLMGDE